MLAQGRRKLKTFGSNIDLHDVLPFRVGTKVILKQVNVPK
jgi:hypothetical protein